MSRSVGGFSNSGLWLPRTYGRSGRKHTRGGIWMKWWSQSLDGKCTCSLLSIAKARFLKFSFSPNVTRPALRLFRKLFRRQGFFPTVIVTNKLRSYGAALREIGFLWFTRARTACQQSSGELASTASATRTKDARLQISQIGLSALFPSTHRFTNTFNGI
jgi:hypothetical protein